MSEQENPEDLEKQRLLLSVKLLFKRIEEGKIAFDPQNVPQTIAAVKAVRFDDEGIPIYETITSPVRALANLVASTELERFQAEVEERAKASPVHEYLPQEIAVTEEILQKCTKEGRLSELAFHLYQETGAVAAVAAHSSVSHKPDEGVLERNQAICAALLIRIVKFMTAVVRLSAPQEKLGEVVMALNRCITESAVDLQFLIVKDDPKLFDQFVECGLAPEREAYDVLLENRKMRSPEVLPIEERLLVSIERLVQASGYKIDQINKKRTSWGGGFRQRCEFLGPLYNYAFTQRIASHSVHGTWPDLFMHHLEAKDAKFRVRGSHAKVDGRLMSPICMIVLEAVRSYLRKFFGVMPELTPLHKRIDDLQRRVFQADQAHEKWLQERQQSSTKPSC
jgi:hypothetical protein